MQACAIPVVKRRRAPRSIFKHNSTAGADARAPTITQTTRSMARAARTSRLDPVSLEIIWSRLISISEEQAATVLGVIFVWLAMRESLWNFPVGLVQAAIFGWVCLEGRLYSETALQLLFMAAMMYGWWHWGRRDRDAGPLRVARLTARGAAAAHSQPTRKNAGHASAGM